MGVGHLDDVPLRLHADRIQDIGQRNNRGLRVPSGGLPHILRAPLLRDELEAGLQVNVELRRLQREVVPQEFVAKCIELHVVLCQALSDEEGNSVPDAHWVLLRAFDMGARMVK